MELDTETVLFYGFIVLLLLIIVVLILLLIHSGFFKEINVQTCKPCIGELRVAYKYARGPYKESGTLFTEVHTLLPKYRTIGVYYDDPRKNEQSRLRYIVGLVLSEDGAPVNAADEATLVEWGYAFATFPAINHAVQASFPFKSTLSIIVAIFRVYPILDEYIEMRSLCVHPFIEVYDNEKGHIFFVGPLEKQDSFYVPEVLEAGEEVQEREVSGGDEEDDDECSSASWDDSASIIKSEALDSDDPGEDAHSLFKNTEKQSEDSQRTHNPRIDSEVPPKDARSARSPLDEASDEEEEEERNAGSSFEEIDDTEAPQSDEGGPPGGEARP